MLKNGISSIDKLKNSKRWQFSTGYGSRTPEYTKIRGHASPVYKMVLYSWPSIPAGSTPANSNQHRLLDPLRFLFISPFFPAFFCDIISDLQKSCKNSAKKSCILFPQIPKILTFYHICFIILSPPSSLSPSCSLFLYTPPTQHTHIFSPFSNHLRTSCHYGTPYS